MIVVKTTPQRDVNGHASKWQANHQPITFGIQRQDAQVYYRHVYTGNVARIKLTTAVPASVLSGQKIYYEINGLKYLLNVVSVSGNYIVTDSTLSGTVSGGVVNFVDAYENYYVETNIISFPYLTSYDSGTAQNRVDLTGSCEINLMEWLKAFAVLENEFNYDELNAKMPQEGGRFFVRFKEIWKGSNNFNSPNFGYYYWVNANKQPLDKYGSNMGEYVPTLDDTRTDKAKFITMFDKPTYFVGFPFSLSFIYSDNMLSYQIEKVEEHIDKNGSLVDDTTTNLSLGGRFYMNRLMLQGTYDDEVLNLNLWLQTGASITTGSVLEAKATDPVIFNPTDPGNPFPPFEEQETSGTILLGG